MQMCVDGVAKGGCYFANENWCKRVNWKVYSICISKVIKFLADKILMINQFVILLLT